MNITIKTIPYAEMRYATCGDWQFDEAGNLNITVVALGNPQYEFLVAYHELTEAMLCQAAGITAAQVDHFDKIFEEERAQGRQRATAEPGDDPRAPYQRQHLQACNAEVRMAELLRVDWDDYEAAIHLLGEPK